MYYVSKRIEIAGAHNLKLNYESKCSNLHGHNWIITVYCKSEKLDENGMVTDFAHIKKQLTNVFDHQYINDIEPFKSGINPTAENMAHYIVHTIPNCYKASVQESEGNVATYEMDEEDEIDEICIAKVTKEELAEILGIKEGKDNESN